MTPGFHIKGDVLKLLRADWDMMIAFPPCTYLSNVGACWWDGKVSEQQAAMSFARQLWNAPISKIVIENPRGRMSMALGQQATQEIQPWMFGDPYTKRTGLWIKGLPRLVPYVTDKPDFVRPWMPGTDSATLKTYDGVARRRDRSLTFPGIAKAMAQQWGDLSP
jgi:hypothetical protein